MKDSHQISANKLDDTLKFLVKKTYRILKASEYLF